MSLVPRYSSLSIRLARRVFNAGISSPIRYLHDVPSTNHDVKYAAKLQRIAQERGMSVDELRVKVKDEARQRQKVQREMNERKLLKTDSVPPAQKPSPASTRPVATRRDSSPVKPLDSILNISRLVSTPHTSAQIAALWTTYHASRPGAGTGYLCATVPLDLYEKMARVASRHSSFVVPIPRERNAEEVQAGEESTAYEFYFLQWDFHETPPMPSTDPFTSSAPSATPNPPTSTVLFTPLQEYKLRNSYATPYLVITHYTDLAQSHGVVLLRGEITPSHAATAAPAQSDGKFLLSQEDAQVLAMGLQRFYLWGKGDGEGERLLKTFHEKPEDFRWEELLKLSNVTV